MTTLQSPPRPPAVRAINPWVAGWLLAVITVSALALWWFLPWQVPDPTDAAVQQEEQRLATLLGNSDQVIPQPGSCKVRLLGRDGGTSYAYAACESAEGSATQLPARIDGTTIRLPGDGSQYSEDVEALFPRRLAREILSHPERFTP